MTWGSKLWVKGVAVPQGLKGPLWLELPSQAPCLLSPGSPALWVAGCAFPPILSQHPLISSSLSRCRSLTEHYQFQYTGI